MKLRHYVILPDLLTTKGPSKREELRQKRSQKKG